MQVVEQSLTLLRALNPRVNTVRVREQDIKEDVVSAHTFTFRLSTCRKRPFTVTYSSWATDMTLDS